MGYKLQYRGYRLRFRGYNQSLRGASDTMNNQQQDDGQLTTDPSDTKPLQEEIALDNNLDNAHDSTDFHIRSPLLSKKGKKNYNRSSLDDHVRYLVPDEVTCNEDDNSKSSVKPVDDSLRQIELRENPDEPHSFNSVEHIENPDEPEGIHTTSLMSGNLGNSKVEDSSWSSSFMCLRLHYLIITLVIMLADGLQGTHLYVLYEGYGFSVASLYCLGFATGGLMSPITGALVDKLGRKKSALLYCILEIAINQLEQYPVIAGLIFSRMVGGVTTNLLSTVFEAWLDTEYRRRGFDKEKYEIIMRDSVIVSNLAAIGSGYLAHILAETNGPVGPFQGAVTFTSIAFIVVLFVWTENYGSVEHDVKGMKEFLNDAVAAFKADKKILRVGVIQGLTCASIQIFIFLWSPALRHFAQSAPSGVLGLDNDGEPAYGLIFGAFMASGVCGGLAAPWVRKLTTTILSPFEEATEVEGEGQVRPMAVEFLAAVCYFVSAVLLLIPCIVSGHGENSFSICLGAFLIYEFIIGLYLPCEGVIRSLYFPSEGRASIMTLPRIIVNVAVSLGVVTTNFITMRSAFSSVFVLMMVSGMLQLSLISDEQWAMLQIRLDLWQKNATGYIFGLSMSNQSVEPVEKTVFMESTRSIPSEMETTSCGSCDENSTGSAASSIVSGSFCSSVNIIGVEEVKVKLD